MKNEWTDKIARLEAENERLEKENKPLSDFRRITKTYKGRGINQTDNMVIIDRQSYEEKEQQRVKLLAIAEKAGEVQWKELLRCLDKLDLGYVENITAQDFQWLRNSVVRLQQALDKYHKEK